MARLAMPRDRAASTYTARCGAPQFACINIRILLCVVVMIDSIYYLRYIHIGYIIDAGGELGHAEQLTMTS